MKLTTSQSRFVKWRFYQGTNPGHPCDRWNTYHYTKKTARSSISHCLVLKNNSKITNLVKIFRIEGYNGKYGSNPQGIREISDDLLEFDQIKR